jgi:hypothetical protein
MATAAQALRQFKRASSPRMRPQLELYPTFFTALALGLRTARMVTPSGASLESGRNTGARC